MEWNSACLSRCPRGERPLVELYLEPGVFSERCTEKLPLRVGLQLIAQAGDSWRNVHLDSSFAQDLGDSILPYERLLHAGLIGDRQLFAREDSIEETWRIVQPLLDAPGEVHPYEPGSWGPEAARSLVHGYRSWQAPWLPGSHPSK